MPTPDERTSPAQQASAPRLLTRKIRVEVIDGPDRGKVAELHGPEARIGTGADASLVLSDRTVSRMHLTLRVEGDAVRVVDEGSLNGTILDGTRVRDAWARPDSTLRLGDTTLCLRMLDELLELPVSPRERIGGLYGRSVAMRRVYSLLEQIAPTDARVLVEGETGTGKELVAEALHQASRRADRPLVVVDCSAVSATLIESELFGHVRGAYTGAVGDRAGAFEAADGGTVFLDEIGELSLALQPNLLRVLERGEVRRVGSNVTRRVDVRVIAATNSGSGRTTSPSWCGTSNRSSPIACPAQRAARDADRREDGAPQPVGELHRVGRVAAALRRVAVARPGPGGAERAGLRVRARGRRPARARWMGGRRAGAGGGVEARPCRR